MTKKRTHTIDMASGQLKKSYFHRILRWYTTYVTEIMIIVMMIIIIIIVKKSKYTGQLVIGNWMKVKSLKNITAFQTGCAENLRRFSCNYSIKFR